MKSAIRSTFAALALFGAVVGVNAQTPVKIVTIEMEKIFEKFYKTEAEQARMKELQTKAEEQIEGMKKELEALQTQAKELQDQTRNPTITDEAKKKAQSELEAKVNDLRAKQGEMQGFAQETQQRLQKRAMDFQRSAVEEISRTATEVAKKKGATLVLNSGGAAAMIVVYSDASFSITDEVLELVNKDRPSPAINVTVPGAK